MKYRLMLTIKANDFLFCSLMNMTDSSRFIRLLSLKSLCTDFTEFSIAQQAFSLNYLYSTTGSIYLNIRKGGHFDIILNYLTV